MKLSEEAKNKIIAILDSKEFMSDLYEGLDKETRDRLGMFYTPGKICIQMIEKFDCDTLSGKNILDPTCGSGNLLIACLIAGADLDKLFGNEYDATAVKLAKRRLLRCAEILGLNLSDFKDYQIHQGNALQKRCLTEFSEKYDKYYDTDYIDDLNYGQGDKLVLNKKKKKNKSNVDILMKVSKLAIDLNISDQDILTVCLLYDSLEYDNHKLINQIFGSFKNEIVDAILLLTEIQNNKILYYNKLKTNKLASIVKILENYYKMLNLKDFIDISEPEFKKELKCFILPLINNIKIKYSEETYILNIEKIIKEYIIS